MRDQSLPHAQAHVVPRLPATRVGTVLALAVALAGVGAVAAISLARQGGVNTGLMRAADAIGKNLWGDAVFGASCRNPCRLDLAGDSPISTAVNVSFPLNPCQVAVQVSITRTLGGTPQLSARYDPNLVAPVAGGLSEAPLQLARCTDVGAAQGNSALVAGVNEGLVNALDSVGKELWGDAMFAATPPTSVGPSDPVRLDIAGDSPIPTVVNVSHPGNPCLVAVQVSVTGLAGAPETTFNYDPSRLTPVAGTIAAPINVARCTAG